MPNFPSGRRQRVVYHGAKSTWSGTNLSRETLGPTFFDIFINDITVNLVSRPLLYANDLINPDYASSSSQCRLPTPARRPQRCHPVVSHQPLASQRGKRFVYHNACSHLSAAAQPPHHAFDPAGIPLRRVDATRLLGVTLDSKLCFH